MVPFVWYPTCTSKDEYFSVDQVTDTCVTLTLLLQTRVALMLRGTRFRDQFDWNTLLVRAASGSHITVYITETKVFTQRHHISQSVCSSTSVCSSVGLLETRSQSRY